MENNIINYKEENENLRLKLELCNRELELSKQRKIELFKQKNLNYYVCKKKLNYIN